jgi:hypothetical protein
MSYELNVNEESGILELRSYGPVSREEIAESMTEIDRLSKETCIKLLFVDSREVDKMPNTIDLFELTSKFPRFLKMAILIPEESELTETFKFGETVGFNRGIPIRVFVSESEAIEWLKS